MLGCTTLLDIAKTVSAQHIGNREFNKTGSIQLSAGISIQKVNSGYTAWIPDKGAVKGLIVFTHARRDTVNPDTLIVHAMKRQLGVIYVTTENRLEFFFDDERIREIEGYIHEVITLYDIPESNLFYCGMSLGGTRAFLLAIRAIEGKTAHGLVPRAIAVCDAPLDMMRFYESCLEAKALDFHAAAANEGEWVTRYLEANLGPTPQSARAAYLAYSPFCHREKGGAHVEKLKEIAVRAYTEPDVNWWIDNRQKDYYGMNAIDMAGLVNALRKLGHRNAQLITTRKQGYLPDGSRHPHSWSIVDELELVGWFAELAK